MVQNTSRSSLPDTALELDPETITGILLSDGKWYVVVPQTFEMDTLRLNGTPIGLGFTCRYKSDQALPTAPGKTMSGLMSSIQAFKHRRRPLS